MPNAFIHAGSPKTGTTAFQLFMQNHSEWLSGQGLHVINAGRHNTGAHHALAYCLQGLPVPHVFNGVRFDFDEEMRGLDGKDVILSSESLQMTLRIPVLRDRIVSTFRNLGYKVIVVMYVRDVLALSNSTYAQGAKSCVTTMGFRDFIYGGEFYTRLPHWRPLSIYPEITYKLRPFNKVVRRNGIVKDLLQTIGISASPPEFTTQTNVSPGPVVVALGRWFIRDHFAKEGFIPFPAQRHTMTVAVQNEAEPLERAGARYCGLTDALARFIDEETLAELNRLSQSQWNMSWKEAFPDADRQGFDCNDLEISDVAFPPIDLWRDAQYAIKQSWKAVKAKPALASPKILPMPSDLLRLAEIDTEENNRNYWKHHVEDRAKA